MAIPMRSNLGTQRGVFGSKCVHGLGCRNGYVLRLKTIG
jgi:hypothetical protein